MLNGKTSFFLCEAGSLAATRGALAGDVSTDICIVGAGYTGLWAAWWLRHALPDRSIRIVEAERVGFGASGRNLGWLSGKALGDRRRLADGPGGVAGVIDLRRACIEAVTEIPSLMRENGIDIEARPCGYLQLARTPAGLARVRATVDDRAWWGFEEADLRYLSRDEIRERVRIDGVLGGLYSPHCAWVQPAKLAIGLGRLLEARGVVIHEGTRVLGIGPGLVETDSGTVRARVVLRATETYSPGLPGLRRAIIPMRSSAIVTEPLSQAEWAGIGWQRGEGLFGAEHWPLFASRTQDGRILLAGRGFPYRYGSRFDDDGHLEAGTIRQLEDELADLFPGARPVVAHAWCGMFGMPRDWSPSVSFDPATGLGSAGGYGGQGLAASYVAGRTFADLVAGRQTRWTRLPWTNRRAPRWEVEPLRWLGARTSYHLFRFADTVEQRFGTAATSSFARLARQLSGRP